MPYTTVTSGLQMPASALQSIGTLQLTNQGGSTNGQFPVLNPLPQMTLQWNASHSAAAVKYGILRGINGGPKTLYDTVPFSAGIGTTFIYTDLAANGFYNAANINEGPTNPIGFTTWYDYDVVELDSQNRFGPVPTQFLCYLYKDGVSFCTQEDLSFGMQSAPDYAATDPLGTTAIKCVKGPGGCGFQTASFNPLSMNFGLEVNMFNYVCFEVYPASTNQPFEYQHLTRTPVGDGFPFVNLQNLPAKGYGTLIGGQYNILSIPLSVLGFGETQALGTLNNGILNITQLLSGPQVIDAASWIAVQNAVTTPGASGGVWVSATPAQSGVGNYTVLQNGNVANGWGVAASNPPNILTPTIFYIHKSNAYKSNLKDFTSPQFTTFYIRKHFFSRYPGTVQ